MKVHFTTFVMRMFMEVYGFFRMLRNITRYLLLKNDLYCIVNKHHVLQQFSVENIDNKKQRMKGKPALG